MRVNPREIITTFKKNGQDAYVAASKLGIHLTTVYRWVKRASVRPEAISSKGLKRKSTKPKKIYLYPFSGKDKADIESLRETTGYMAEKIVSLLGLSCHPRTIHRFLTKKGLVREYGYHLRPKFQETIHMHTKNTKTIGYLQMDVKYVTPQLSGLPYTCFEYAVIDIFSRYKEAVILNQLDQDGSISALLEIIPRLPFKPVFIQTDNGLEFQERFHQIVVDMGIKHHMIHKNTPNENALIERSFRTDEEEFFFRLDRQPQHYDELRQLFAAYLHEYNHIRPHLGIDLRTPYEVVANVLSG